ncbi:MAG: cell wall hydrolase [Bacillota bacterium]
MKITKKMVTIYTIVLCLLFSVSSVFAANYTTLKFGSRGSAVVQLQQKLTEKGFLTSSVDGIYGKKTEKAVIDFQIASRIRIDGIAGNETQSKLYAAPVVSRGSTTARDQYASNVYWLSRIIHAEAEAEPYNGKVAVGNVILNRVNSKDFPNTVYNVIFEYYEGIPQFSPVAEGTIYNTPSEESIKAAKDALTGVRPAGASTYFFNPDKSAGKWIVQNKTYVMRIGNHVFYK